MKHLKKFETQAAYEAYTADTSNFIKPNVSLTVDNNTVHYNPYVPETRVVAKYNVTTDTKTQKILGHIQTGPYSAGVTTAFASVYVDGNEIEISDANINYTFDTVGEHTVKYELKDPTTINKSAFNGYVNGSCSGIKAVSITIPYCVTSIGSNAFEYCTSLTSIVIPSGVTSIGSNAFEYCTSLTSIVCNATTAPTIDYGTFRNVKTGGTLTVPIGSSGYDTWMQNASYYLGLYGWTKVEQ